MTTNLKGRPSAWHAACATPTVLPNHHTGPAWLHPWCVLSAQRPAVPALAGTFHANVAIINCSLSLYR